jgi:hypothetical protein
VTIIDFTLPIFWAASHFLTKPCPVLILSLLEPGRVVPQAAIESIPAPGRPAQDARSEAAGVW